MYKKITISIISVLLLGFIVLWLLSTYPYLKMSHNKDVTTRVLDSLQLDNTHNLMIVAHPDDDAIWGGAHLLSEDYLVVCLTNKSNKTRSNEFAKIMKAFGDKCIILDYPDKVLGKRADWSRIEKSLKRDIKTILEYKDWQLVVTHNQAGEYGHAHHIATHNAVTQLMNNKENLWYFGTYYSKGALDSLENPPAPISAEALQEKLKLLEIYKSQSVVIEHLSHMLPYEQWTQ